MNTRNVEKSRTEARIPKNNLGTITNLCDTVCTVLCTRQRYEICSPSPDLLISLLKNKSTSNFLISDFN